MLTEHSKTLVSWSRSCDKAKAPTLKTKAKALKSKSKTKTKAVKISLEAASSRGTVSRHHITGFKSLPIECRKSFVQLPARID